MFIYLSIDMLLLTESYLPVPLNFASPNVSCLHQVPLELRAVEALIALGKKSKYSHSYNT